jgi:hypothetical protein
VYREHISACELQGYSDEAARGRWALGKVIGGAEGEALSTSALQALEALGYVQPSAEVCTHFPELARPAVLDETRDALTNGRG